MSEPFIAEIKIFAGNFAPRGFSFCDGQLLPIAQNTALFSLIGTTFGGDGRTTTALPDLRGRFPMHAGGSAGPGLTRRLSGQRVGQATVALSEARMPAHDHALMVSPEEATTGAPATTVALARATEVVSSDPETTEARNLYGPVPAASDRVGMADAALDPTGGGQAHENRHPHLALRFIIATVGLYPSRA